jgi:hypothetical protein
MTVRIGPNSRILASRRRALNALAIMLKPIHHGWAVTLSNGSELVRFTGLGAKRRALRYLASHYVGREAGHVL